MRLVSLAAVATGAFLTALVASLPAAAQGSVVFTVTWVEERRGGQWEGFDPNRIVTVTLQGGNRVSDTDRWLPPRVGGHRGGGPPQRTATNDTTFGGGFGNVEGLNTVATWRVGANNSLQRTARYATDVEVLTITPRGRNACAATVSIRLIPGYGIHRRPIGDFRSIRARGVTCRVAAG